MQYVGGVVGCDRLTADSLFHAFDQFHALAAVAGRDGEEGYYRALRIAL